MVPCKACGRPASRALGHCYECLKAGKGLERAKEVHASVRLRLGLPPSPPKGGLKCGICINECEVPRGEVGYCGVWRNVGHLKAEFKVYTYLDPLPTNCVASPTCPAATSRGYPTFTDVRGPEVGYFNLAVFAYGCTLDCLFCQNWEHKVDLFSVRPRSPEELVEEALRPDVRCVCFFGGDPTPLMPHLIGVSREILKRSKGIKRICWETNGLANPRLMKLAAEISLKSGGTVKVDWKAWNPRVYEALTGVSGEKALERLKHNTRLVAELGLQRPDPPLLVVSVLLVPLYVTLEEVRKIAEHVASLPGEVPLVLLAFYPTWFMSDLPPTSREHAEAAVRVAREAGVKEVYLENVHLLSDAEYPF